MKAIRATNLGKKYQIDKARDGSCRQLCDELMQLFKGVNLKKEEFWAIQGINLEIEAGETVGIIGPNGSGKSTLLKLLARVAYPTTGQIELHGRVGALLEVGTGFHVDLTGRENIYLAGAILGMNRREVKRQFDEIISFSGVEEFLDVPVKRYSNGMFLRLAFSVMAYLRNEILIIDEILAVGDQEFQKKCLRKMEEVAAEGRTVLFVSHQLEVVQGLCTRILEMDKGRFIGDSKAALHV